MCAYWMLSDCERCNKDVTCRLQSCWQPFRCGKLKVCQLSCRDTRLHASMHAAVCITNAHVGFLRACKLLFSCVVLHVLVECKAICHLSQNYPSTDCYTKNGTEHLAR